MPSPAELWGVELVRHAVWAGLLASVLCGVLGTFVVVKRLVAITGGLSHAAFGGLGLFHFLGLAPLAGAAVAAVASALVLARLGLDRGGGKAQGQDATIGILWAAGMAAGYVFVHRTPGFAPDLMTYLFGDILSVDRGELRLTAVLVAVVLLGVGAFYKELQAVAFDEEFAAVQGVRVGAVTTFLLVLVALAVVVLIQVVGILLVIALMAIPPLIGLRLARDFAMVLVVASLAGCVLTLGGLLLAYRLDLPAGPAVVLLGTAALGVAYLPWPGRRRRRARA